MTAVWITGLVMGAVGSLHCIGMCGPLALSLPVSDDKAYTKFVASLLYNLGRVITYALIGAVTGLLGRSFSLFGFQQGFSVVMGILIIGFVMLPSLGNFLGNVPALHVFFEKLRARIGSLYFKKNFRSVFLIGMLNGLLPCGLIYMALAVSMTMGTAWHGSLFMAGFGMGTLPVMWSVAFFGGFINMNIRRKIRRLYPYLMVLMACLLIIRGLGWGVPFLSPSVDMGNGHTAAGIECHQ